MRVGFLFNHYLTYQVLHGAPLAFELSRMYPHIRTELLFSSGESLAEAARIATAYPTHRCAFRLLKQTGITGLLSTGIPSLHRPLTLLANLGLLASYDALVAPEKNYIVLKSLPAFRSIKFIGLRHGAGDRPVSFNKGRLKFDYLLVPGQSYYERFQDELPVGCCEVVGYAKFEALQKLNAEQPPLFDNNRKVVWYTPHFHRRQSSWLTMGRDILTFFRDNQDYNLIFAPHVRLFKHRSYRGNINLDEFRDVSNMLIDTGSERLHDMSYAQAADIYLGDVSSQVYEFQYYRRRPCVFLNPNGLDGSQMNFWKTGTLIDGIDALEKALAITQDRFEEEYRTAQDSLVAAAFATDSRPPSQRGADAIARFLGG